ncbi:hypothetical protein A7982_12945 [Minicystis rosea]|nr:hypothetical protein A7982_12945 [Minicystis rosea]
MPSAAVGLPPCCAGCSAYDGEDRVCRLLADPSLPNRRTLLTMPCDVQRLLGLRFRSYGPDVARDALVAFLDPAWDPDDISLSYGRAPRDARLWLGSWPYLYLGRNAVRRVHRDGERLEPSDHDHEAAPATADPALALRMTRALAAVHGVDPVGYAMLLDFLHDRFDAQAWSTKLGWAAASVTDRKYLSVYRYAVYFHDVLAQVLPREAAVALVARRFSPGDPTEHAALEATRTALSLPGLTMASWRQMYREGAALSLTLLAAPDAVGLDTMAELETAFRRVLRLDVGAR